MRALRRWWRRHLGREFYRLEVTELRRALVMQGTLLVATEELLNEKQRKINRLVTGIHAMRRTQPDLVLPGVIGRHDLGEEVLHTTAQAMMQRYTADFEERRKQHEKTGTYGVERAPSTSAAREMYDDEDERTGD